MGSLTVLIFAALGIYMILKGIRKRRCWNAEKMRSNGRNNASCTGNECRCILCRNGTWIPGYSHDRRVIGVIPGNSSGSGNRYICRIQTGTERKQTCILGRGSTPFTCQFRRNSPLLYVKMEQFDGRFCRIAGV